MFLGLLPFAYSPCTFSTDGFWKVLYLNYTPGLHYYRYILATSVMRFPVCNSVVIKIHTLCNKLFSLREN